MSVVKTKQRLVTPQKNLYYCRLEGNNSFDGKSLEYAVADADTLIARAKANIPTPSATGRVIAQIVDGGNYEKFSLTGGAGFITLEANNTAFDVITTGASPVGITIGPGYSANLGFIRHSTASTEAGTLLKCNTGANQMQIDVKQIFSGTAYDNVLFESAGNHVEVDIDDIHHATSRDSTAILVSAGLLILKRLKRLTGKIIVAAGAQAIIEAAYFDGDIAVEGDGKLDIRGAYWNGDTVTEGDDMNFITNYSQHIIP